MKKVLLLLITCFPIAVMGMDKEIHPPSYDACIHGDAPFYQPHINGILQTYNLYLPQLDSGDADEVNAKLAAAYATRANPYNAVFSMQFDQPTRSLDGCRPECRPCIKGILCLACSIPAMLWDALTGSCMEEETLEEEDLDACCKSTRRLIQIMQE